MTATCTVTSHLRVTGATPTQCEKLLACGRVASPAYERSIKSGILRWRRPAEFIHFAHREGDSIVLSRGLMADVRREVPGVAVVDARQSAPASFTFTRELRPEQHEAVSAITRCQQGGIVGPPGIGKSTIILAGVAACAQVAAILVPSLPILAQFDRDVRDLMGIKAAVIGEGREEVGDLTLATFASMRDPGRRERVFARIGTLAVDEFHGVTGDETRVIVDACPAKFRIGGTATWPTDLRSPILHALVGPVIYRVAVPEMVDLGRLERPEYRQVRTAFQGTGNDFSKLVEGTVEDGERNELVLATIAKHCGPGALGLALYGRVSHAKEHADQLRSRGMRAESLTGDVRKAERERILTAARAGDLDVVCATSLADEGLDIPLISRLFLVAPQKAGGRFFQRVGRTMRPHPSKPSSLCFDFCDFGCGLLGHQARGRARAFAALWHDDARAA